ncbi:MAG: hypothetical protein ABFD16_09670 [Thermoguttaceae bacterium]|jgi:hypothetical protein
MAHAKVTSIDAVDEMAVALRRFGEEAANALADLDLELKRALDWLQHDRKDYWDAEVRRNYDRVAEARNNLQRRMICRPTDDRPAATEEKKALELAKRRLDVSQQKVQAVRHWSMAVQHELQEYVGAINLFTTWLQGDLPKALASLKRMSLALEAYVNLPAGAEPEELSAAPTREEASDGPRAPDKDREEADNRVEPSEASSFEAPEEESSPQQEP